MVRPPPTSLRAAKLNDWIFYMVQTLWQKFFIVLSQFTRLTDREKDGNVVANTALHSMER